eukprot:scaffold653_cov345-Pavlova_lutheri.AAC.14
MKRMCCGSLVSYRASNFPRREKGAQGPSFHTQGMAWDAKFTAREVEPVPRGKGKQWCKVL